MRWQSRMCARRLWGATAAAYRPTRAGRFAKHATPPARRLARHHHIPLGQQLRDITIVQGETTVSPHAVGDDRGREALACVAGGGGVFSHAPRIACPPSRQADRLP